MGAGDGEYKEGTWIEDRLGTNVRDTKANVLTRNLKTEPFLLRVDNHCVHGNCRPNGFKLNSKDCRAVDEGDAAGRLDYRDAGFGVSTQRMADLEGFSEVRGAPTEETLSPELIASKDGSDNTIQRELILHGNHLLKVGFVITGAHQCACRRL